MPGGGSASAAATHDVAREVYMGLPVLDFSKFVLGSPTRLRMTQEVLSLAVAG